MRRFILLLSFCYLAGACNQSPEMEAFEAFKKQIPHIELPYKCACYDKIKCPDLAIQGNIFKKYAPEGASGIIGIIKDTDYFTAILYSVEGDIQYPVIQTYDPSGNKLNDIGLLSGTCCGDDTVCMGFSWGEITTDFSIILADSERIYNTDHDGYRIESDSRYIDSNEIYTFTNKGYIRIKPAHSALAKAGFNRIDRKALPVTPKEKEPAKPAASNPVAVNSSKIPDDPAQIIYKVQIISSPLQIPPGDARFKIIPDLEVYMEKNIYKYTTGHFTSKEEAMKLQNRLREDGFKEAFVVAFKGKNRVKA